MRFLVLLAVLMLIFAGLSLSLKDDDNDGFCEDNDPSCRIDRCPNTAFGEIVDLSGCSCRQKTGSSSQGNPWHCPPVNESGPDSACIERCGVADFKATCNVPLSRIFDDRAKECPEDICTIGKALIDFPDSGNDRCEDGKYIEHSCKIKEIMPNYADCAGSAPAEEEMYCDYNGNNIAKNTCLHAVIGDASQYSSPLDYSLYCMCETGFIDNDGDGYSPYSAEKYDCNDDDEHVNINAREICSNSIDDNCNIEVNDGCGGRCDVDKDGYYSSGLSPFQKSICSLESMAKIFGLKGGNDCDDLNPYRYAGAEEICDRIDNNCDNIDDEKHFGDIKEICDRTDNNCNGVTDEGCECADGEEQRVYGLCRDGLKKCADGKWQTIREQDMGAEGMCEPVLLVENERITSDMPKQTIEVGRQFTLTATFICTEPQGCGDVAATLK